MFVENIKHFILITRFDCKIDCNGANLTILGGNERWDWDDSNDTKINAKDWIDAILHAIWIYILK